MAAPAGTAPHPTRTHDSDPLPGGGGAGALAPRLAAGVELLGELAGSGYREPPWLVRRSDGQMLQVTAVLHALLEAVDGERGPAELSEVLRDEAGLGIEPEDVAFLLEDRLRPLGVLLHPDGSEPELQRSNPLLGLRGRVAMVGADRTTAIAQRAAAFFRPAVVLVVVGLFLATTGWLFVTEDLGAATRDLFHQPGALLAVIVLTIVSAAFHEVGHAAACYYGGATPGPMGAGLYLVWPAFYTDVSDSYRLSRGGRLRVDLGGLYFNTLFSVASFGAWVVTGWNPLLIVMVTQLLQMLRQLAPLVRFDGYHVLADLVGVPDLFARVRPVLVGLLPTRWGSPEARVLKPWARTVVSAWVLLVAPILALSLLVMVLSFPRIAATAAESLGSQWDGLVAHWADAEIARTLLSLVTMLTIALPVASGAYLIARLGRQAGTKAWRATDGNRPARRALVVASVGTLVALTAAWWPQGQYEPIAKGEPLTLPALGLGHEAGAPRLGEGSTDPLGSARQAGFDRPVRGAQEAAAPLDTPGVPGGYEFTVPAAPRAQDNQALAIGYEEGETLIDTAHSLEWADEGDVDHRNQAYAMASCTGCRTTAVAFQLVLVVGDHDLVAPRNEALAKNVQCRQCQTRALAVQLVLPLAERPDAGTLAELDAIWARLGALESTTEGQGFDGAYALLRDVEADLVALLAPGSEVLEETTTTSSGEPGATTTTTDASGSVTTTSDGPVTTEPEGTTTTEAPATSTTTTTAPSTTTTSPPEP